MELFCRCIKVDNVFFFGMHIPSMKTTFFFTDRNTDRNDITDEWFLFVNLLVKILPNEMLVQILIKNFVDKTIKFGSA